MLADSGATCNLTDKATWDSLKQQHVKCRSEKLMKKIYAQTALKTLGKFSTTVAIGSCKTEAVFIVIDGSGRPILGRDTAVELNVLRVGPEVNRISWLI